MKLGETMAPTSLSSPWLTVCRLWPPGAIDHDLRKVPEQEERFRNFFDDIPAGGEGPLKRHAKG